MTLPPPRHTEAQLRALWDRWPRHVRVYYEGLLDIAKPHEREPLQAASAAAAEVERLRVVARDLADRLGVGGR